MPVHLPPAEHSEHEARAGEIEGTRSPNMGIPCRAAINASGKRLLALANQEAGRRCTQLGITRRPYAHRSASSGAAQPAMGAIKDSAHSGGYTHALSPGLMTERGAPGEESLALPWLTRWPGRPACQGLSI